MDIKTLESFKLSDAVYFHDELNNNLWDENNKIRPEVKNQLMLIAKDFIDELGIKDLDVKDVTVSGSNAAYSYTKHSDLDLHILVDMSNLPNNEVYKELFTAKKNLYNDSHDIKVHGVPVELYIQDSKEPVVSLGEYSLLNNKWLRIPTKRRANFDQTITKQKYEKLLDIIKQALKSKDLEKINNIITTIKRYRKAGLDKGGEFGPENLAYKVLRTQGYIDKLYQLRDKLHSKDLSIEGKYQEDYDPNGTPPGPEFKPTMPAGTVRVDVSDVYDWYKLGQHISNMKGLGKHDFGKGPPSTIMAFGSEPEEHKYIKNLEKTGLTTTDIDPVDVNQPKGMKRQKVDPTFNVNEKINPDIVKSNFNAETVIDIKDVGPLKLKAYNISTNQPQQFKVEVYNKDNIKIAYFRFVVHDYDNDEPKFKIFSKFKKKPDPYLIAGNAVVWDDYQKKGIASAVYKWVKSMGNDIKPSPYQSDAGKAMWRGFNANKAFAEDQTLQYAAEKTPAINPYGGLKDKQFRGAISEMPDTSGPVGVQPGGWRTYKPRTIDEAFDQPYELKWEKSHFGDYDALAKLDDGTFLSIMFNNEYKKNWMVEFYRNNSQQVTGEGDAQRIFATVLHAIGQFIKKKKPTSLFFSAVKEDDPTGSRSKLYDRLVQRYASSLGYTVRKQEEPGSMSFKLVRNQEVKEGDTENFTFNQPRRKLNIPLLIQRGAIFITHPHGPNGWETDRPDWDFSLITLQNVLEKSPPWSIEYKKYIRPKSYPQATQKFFDQLSDQKYNQILWSIKKLGIPDNQAFLDIQESASGYIPSNAEKNDPRFKTALTVDIKPDTMKKDAKKFGNKISRAGIPPTLNPSGKF